MARKLHRLLLRQLRKAGCEDVASPLPPEVFERLLERVSQSYVDAEEDRYTIERSLEVCSREMQQLNEDLHDEQDKLQSMISDGLCHLDPRGRIRTLNPEAERLLGLTFDAGEPLDLFTTVAFHSDADDPRRLDPGDLAALLGEGRPSSFPDALVERGDGSRVPVTIDFNPILSDGEVRGSMVVLRDRTERRRAERRLREANVALAAARDAAEAASEAKSRFLAAMSHEVRTPLHAILGSLELLGRTALEQEQVGLAETASRSAEHLLGLLDNILDFSKIEAGEIRLDDVAFDLRSDVEDAVALHAQSTRPDVVLACHVDGAVPEIVTGDRTRLQQVLSNLVANAVKFTERGTVMLRASLVERRTGSAVVRFEVSDTGIGISDADRERIFSSFTQADDSTTRRFGGTGLGLAISHDLVTLMGGRLELESAVGRGSRFSFELLLRTSAAQREALPSVDRARVLVVEGHEAHREVLADYLRQLGARPRAVATLGEAEMLLQRTTFDLAILDELRSGELDLVENLRAHPRFGGRPIGLASPSFEARTDAPAAGAQFVLAKPVRRRALWEAVRRALEAPRPVEPPAAKSARSAPLAGRVLLVEDNAINQVVAKKMLTLLGAEVDIAKDGQEGVELSALCDYDLILMDCQMPRMDGFEATRVIREREEGVDRRTPIVAMTANATSRDRDRCFEAGMDDYLSKPATIAVLTKALFPWIGVERRADGRAA